MTIPHNIIKDLKSLISSLTSDDKYKEYFKSDIKFLEERLRVWGEGQIRIGLIGVTSSGKSTLINALLGQKILPQRVRPSSSVIVICEYGEKTQATVYFDGNSSESSKVFETDIQEALEQYADEGWNQGNSKHVSEVHVQAPGYKLPHDVCLIDSPGLDAFGMEGHEKITLQLALPTLDMVLFLTTAKANPDRENLIRIDQVTEDDKPLMVVQNMIDSLVEDKNSEGVIISDIAAKQSEHKQRVENLLQNANKESTRAAKVIQVSATYGLEGRWKESNLDSLIDNIDSNKNWLLERSILARATQISIRLDEMITGLKSMESDDQYLNDELEKYSSLKAQIDALKRTITLKEKNSHQEAESLSKKRTKFNKSYGDINSAKNAGKELFALPKALNKEFSAHIKDVQQQQKSIARALNLRAEDMNYRLTKPSEGLTFSVPTKEEKVPYKVKEKQSGLGGSIKRGLGFGAKVFGKDNNWGYKYVTKYDISTIVDKAKFIEVVKYKINTWIHWYLEAMHSFSEQAGARVVELEKELKQNVTSLNRKQAMNISDAEKKKMLSKLTRHQKKLSLYTGKDEAPSDAGKSYRTRDKTNTIEVPQIIHDLFSLGHMESYKIFIAMRDYCIDSMRQPEALITIGWDDIDLKRFSDLYFSDFIDIEGVNSGDKKKSGEVEGPMLTVINEDHDNLQEALKTIKIPSKRTGIFVILDIQQSGIAEKKIQNLKLQSIDNLGVTWVLQSIESLLNSDSLIEGYIELFDLLERSNLPVDSLLVTNKDPLFSILLFELYKNGNKLLSARDAVSVERQWLARIDEVLGLSQEKKDEFIKYLREYKLLKSDGVQ